MKLINWKLIIIIFIGLAGVCLRDYMNDWMKVLWIILIIGGVIWSAFIDTYPVQIALKTGGEE